MDKCPIWEVEAGVERHGHYAIIDSPRAGGKYWISGTAEAIVALWDSDQKKRLTTLLCEERSSGVEIPRVDERSVEFIKSRKALSVPQRVTKALIFLADLRLGRECSLGNSSDADTLRVMAETESTDFGEVRKLYRMLEASSYVDATFYAGGEFRVAPTLGGWAEIDRRANPTKDSSQAFVAMWFDQSLSEAFVSGIEPAVRATGHKALRIDNKEHSNKIDDEIIAEIRRSRFLIADFTCKPKEIRGGVYYEAGFAMGIGIPVIWTCRKGSEDDLHFDTRQYAHIIWETPQDLFEKLKNRIGAVIGDGPLSKVGAE